MQTKNHFFISCKECRVESPRNFYGCFYLGPFKASQSLTVANTLRRTLLSELNGFAITSVYIEGADHEYATLPGVRDSVLDILLNLKEIVLKNIFPITQPVLGYLQSQGPKVVRASDLKLPNSIQYVDPDQYIATLSYDGKLHLKFIISEGKNYICQTPKMLQDENQLKTNVTSFPLCVDPVFMPVNKVNYMIEPIPYDYPMAYQLRTKNEFQNQKTNEKQQLNNHLSSQDQHVVILEIWTNGSIHPREALSEAIKDVLVLFSSLNKMTLISSSINQIMKSSAQPIQKRKNTL